MINYPSVLFFLRHQACCRVGNRSFWTHTHHGISSSANGFPEHAHPTDSLCREKISGEGKESGVYVAAKLGCVCS